jgi:hypothetical protein
MMAGNRLTICLKDIEGAGLAGGGPTLNFYSTHNRVVPWRRGKGGPAPHNFAFAERSEFFLPTDDTYSTRHNSSFTSNTRF